jgi:hypothetical protein
MLWKAGSAITFGSDTTSRKPIALIGVLFAHLKVCS